MLFEIRRTIDNDKHFNELITLLDQELWNRYPDIQQNYTEKNITDNTFMVVVGYESQIAVSCGALKPVGQKTIELKRMFTRKEYRRKGYSRQILHELEKWAKEKEAEKIILETGSKQPEAIGLYQNEGYCRIENYGEYKNNPNSICMEKSL